MTEHANGRNDYERGSELAEAGRHEEALELIRRHLERHPGDAEAANDVGTLLYALGRFDEAARQLHGVIEGPDCPPEALHNFAEAALVAGWPGEVSAAFGRMEAEGLLDADLVNRTATAFLDSGDVPGAVECLTRSLDMLPGQAVVLEPILKNVLARRPKVAIFADRASDPDLADVHRFISRRFETVGFFGLEATDASELGKALAWCDIAWLEGLGRRTAAVARADKMCRLVCRVRQSDVFGPETDGVPWERFDAVFAAVNGTGLELLRRKAPGVERLTKVVPVRRGVDLRRHAMRTGPRNKKLAWVSDIADGANPGPLIQCFAALREADDEYELHVAGAVADDATAAYAMNLIHRLGLQEAIHFDGWQEDLPAWLAEKDAVVHAGFADDVPLGVLQGMARGLKPAVQYWPGAETVLDESHLFGTVSQFVSRIADEPYDPPAYRRFVEERYPLDAELDAVRGILEGFEAEPFTPSRPEPAALATGPEEAAPARIAQIEEVRT